MKLLPLILAFSSSTLISAQGHDLKPNQTLKQLQFLKGNWKGHQDFVTGGAPLTGIASDKIDWAIGQHYLEEHLSTTLPGRKPSDTRHFITYDPHTQQFKAWWFNDASVGAMELAGTFDGTNLTLESVAPSTATGKQTTFHAVYTKVSDSELTFTLSIHQGDQTQKLFTTTYHRS